jgi:hypothetical protein
MNILLAVVAAVIILFLLFRMVKVIIRIALVALFFIVAYFTNPDLEHHQQAVKKKAAERSVKINKNDVHVRDYKILSFTKVSHAEEESWVGIGAFTKVWIVGSLL